MKQRIYSFLAVMFMAVISLNAYAKEDIGITPKQYAERLNTHLKSFDFPAKMPTKLTVAEGEANNTAQAMLTDSFGVTIVINKKTGKVKGIMTAMTPTSNPSANLLLFAANASAMSAFAGRNEMENVGGKFIRLSTEVIEEYANTADKESGVKKDFTQNGMKFGMMASSTMGIFSYAELAK